MKAIARFSLALGMLCLALLAFAPSTNAQDAGTKPAPMVATGSATVTVKYDSLPGGLTFEGAATGFAPITSISYDKKKERFTINNDASYELTVGRKDFLYLAEALLQDDRLGVSLGDGANVVYGKLSRRASFLKTIRDADLFLGYVAFGDTHKLKGVKLPGNYKPQSPAKRTIDTAVHFNMTDFTFQKKGPYYVRTHCNLEITLWPLSTKRAEDGGHLPDWEAKNAGRMEPEDKANVAHMTVNAQTYLAMEKVAKAAKIAETAAFIRLLRDSKIDVKGLMKQMK